jgi:hypothetical protein
VSFLRNLCHVFVEIFYVNKTREENKHRKFLDSLSHKQTFWGENKRENKLAALKRLAPVAYESTPSGGCKEIRRDYFFLTLKTCVLILQRSLNLLSCSSLLQKVCQASHHICKQHTTKGGSPLYFHLLRLFLSPAREAGSPSAKGPGASLLTMTPMEQPF